MVRLVVRKSSSRTARRSVKRATPATRVTTSRRKGTNQRETAGVRTAQPYYAKVNAFLELMTQCIARRKEQFGSNDPVAKKLQTIQTGLTKELRKKNLMNLSFAKYVNQITPALRGVANVPQSFKNSVIDLKKFFKTYAFNEVQLFNTQMRKTLTPILNELKKLEGELNKEIKKAKSINALPQVNPILRQRFATLIRQFVAFRTYWITHLNKFKLHSTKNLETSLNQIKKLIDEKHREFNRNLAIINRYSKTVQNAAGTKIHQIFAPMYLKALETKWNQVNQQSNKYKKEAARFFEQLKTAKHF